MTAEALKQAALDHLAEERVAAFSLPLGDDLFVCAGTKEEIGRLVFGEPSAWQSRRRPFGDVNRRWHSWQHATQDDYDHYLQNPTPAVEVRALYAATPPQAKEEE